MVVKLIVTWFGVGLVSKAPGTLGTLAGMPFAFAITGIFGHTGLLLAMILLFLLGCVASERYERTKGGHDHSEIVIDEVAGIWLMLAALPVSWQAYLAAFVLFRLFDIVKPWPVNWFDKHIGGGLGVMTDDIAAALYPFILWALLSYAGGWVGIEAPRLFDVLS